MSDLQSEAPANRSLPSETPTSGSLTPVSTPIGTPSSDTPPTIETLAQENPKKEECGPCREVRSAFGRKGDHFLAYNDKEQSGYV